MYQHSRMHHRLGATSSQHSGGTTTTTQSIDQSTSKPARLEQSTRGSLGFTSARNERATCARKRRKEKEEKEEEVESQAEEGAAHLHQEEGLCHVPSRLPVRYSYYRAPTDNNPHRTPPGGHEGWRGHG